MTQLDLTGNRIDDEGAEYLADALSNNTVIFFFSFLISSLNFHLDTDKTVSVNEQY